jgi:hypothetical protein
MVLRRNGEKHSTPRFGRWDGAEKEERSRTSDVNPEVVVRTTWAKSPITESWFVCTMARYRRCGSCRGCGGPLEAPREEERNPGIRHSPRTRRTHRGPGRRRGRRSSAAGTAMAAVAVGGNSARPVAEGGSSSSGSQRRIYGGCHPPLGAHWPGFGPSSPPPRPRRGNPLRSSAVTDNRAHCLCTRSRKGCSTGRGSAGAEKYTRRR